MREREDEGFLLHARPYRETSALLEFFTPDLGRIAVVARGVRRGRRALPAPFIRYHLKLKGEHELKNLLAAEVLISHWLPGPCAACGLYLNELLMRLTQRDDPHPGLFAAYADVLGELNEANLEVPLRRFETRLLRELGYGVEFDVDCQTHEAVEIGRFYRIHEGQGFTTCHDTRIPGAVLRNIADDDFSDLLTRRWAKRIMRQLIAQHLPRPLLSAELLPVPLSENLPADRAAEP